MKSVKVYTTNRCGYCVALKSLLNSKKIAFEEIDVSEDDEKRAWLVQASGQRTVPQMFVDDVSYGGFTDIRALDKSGELDAIVGR